MKKPKTLNGGEIPIRFLGGIAVGAILLAGFCVRLGCAASQSSAYVATNWQNEEGLPQNSVLDIIQDHDGYLRLATSGGVARFDGMQFSVIGAAQIRTLVSNRFLALHEDRSGDLWLGTQSSGLIRLHLGVATTYTERDGLPDRLINSIREDAAGGLWVNTPAGIARFAGGAFHAYNTHHGKPVREFFLQARDGSMWFRSGVDVVRFGPDGSIATSTGGFMAHETPDGSVWIGYHDQYRLVRYYRGVFSDVPLPPPSPRQWIGKFPEQGVLAMATDTDGALLLLTPAGFVRAEGGKLTAPEPLRLPINTAELPKVWTLLVDREGNRWVGTLSTGLFRFRRAAVTAYAKDEGLSDSPFTVLFQDREGRIWLGGDQVYWFDGNRFHLFPALSDIGAIEQTSDGDLWFGGSGGLFRWRSGKLTRFRIEAPAVIGIHQDRQGTLWILGQTYGTPGGLFRFRNGQFEKVAPESSSMLEDRDGGLWVFGSQKARHLRGATTVVYDTAHGLPFTAILAPYQDPTGTIWMPTNGGGLYRFRNDRFAAITVREGLHSDAPGAPVVDDRGNLWFGSNSGIVRLSLEDLNNVADGKLSRLSFVSYGIAEGMKTSECYVKPLKARDGLLWFASLRGVAVVDPNFRNAIPPPVVLEEASANQVKIEPGDRTSIPPGNNTFDFTFTALSLSAPEKQRFKYRLEPYDKAWVDAGTRRTAHYTNMAPGEYSFRVIAANSFGVWNEKGAEIHFALRPHIYETSWFFALCGLALLALLWAALELRVHRMQAAFNTRLEGRVEERTRIARELHDTLLQSFQAALIQMQAAYNLLSRRPEQAAMTLEEAITTSEGAIVEGREAIQGMRSSAVTRNDLARALRIAGDELAAHSSATFQLKVEGSSRDVHPILRDEVYRIAVEAIRNAFKYAEARAIEAEISYGDSLRVRIRDDGKGIDPSVIKEGRHGHYGLAGMRERAEHVGGRLDVWTAAGAGTEIQLTIPGTIAFGTSGARALFRRFPRKGTSEAAKKG